MPQFHETRMGQIFFAGKFPKMVSALESIALELKRSNDLKELELTKSESKEVL